MKTYTLLFGATLLLACQTDPPPSSSPVEALCSDSAKTLDYADFYWDNLRTTNLELFNRALSICSRQCPQSDACAPVLSVALWYKGVPRFSPEPIESNEEERPQ